MTATSRSFAGVRRVAALFDIHGNLPALEAVLADVRREGVDAVVVGGDVVPGPMAREVMDVVTSLDVPTRFVYGNGDHDTLVLRRGEEPARVPAQYRHLLRWSAGQLTDAHAEAMASWPLTIELQHATLGRMFFCHATARDDNEIFTRATPDEQVERMLADVRCDVVVCGHTHMQFDRRVGALRVVNAGSVGMPFGEPGAYWLLLDDDVHLRKTSYDIEAAAARVRRTAYPQADEFAERSILAPPSEAAMLKAFGPA